MSFAGGGTDVPYYINVSGEGALVNAAINVYSYATLIPNRSGGILMRSLDYDQKIAVKSLSDLEYNGELDILKAVVKVMGAAPSNFELISHSEAPPGSGLGLSSVVTVALVGALKEHLNLTMSKHEVADLAYKIERVELGVKGGYQDQYAAVFGGFNFMMFKGGEVFVTPLRVGPEVLSELRASLLLCNIGRTRDSSKIHRRISKKAKRKGEVVIESLNRQRELAFKAEEALLKGQIEELGELVHESWECKRRLDVRVSIPYIDELYRVAREAGAVGGKVSGAGGGGHMLLLCRPERRPVVAKELVKRGCRIVRFDFDFEGLSIWGSVDGRVIA